MKMQYDDAELQSNQMAASMTKTEEKKRGEERR